MKEFIFDKQPVEGLKTIGQRIITRVKILALQLTEYFLASKAFDTLATR